MKQKSTRPSRMHVDFAFWRCCQCTAPVSAEHASRLAHRMHTCNKCAIWALACRIFLALVYGISGAVIAYTLINLLISNK